MTAWAERGWYRENAMRPPSSFRAVGNVSERSRSPCPRDAQHFQSDPTDPAEPVALGCLPKRKNLRSAVAPRGEMLDKVAGEHAPAATDRAKSFQADDEGSIPFTRSMFKNQRVVRNIEGAECALKSAWGNVRGNNRPDFELRPREQDSKPADRRSYPLVRLRWNGEGS